MGGGGGEGNGRKKEVKHAQSCILHRFTLKLKVEVRAAARQTEVPFRPPKGEKGMCKGGGGKGRELGSAKLNSG